MKKFLLSIAILALSVSVVYAQETSAEGLRWKGLYNNGFWSNMELTIGGGVTYSAWNDFGSDQGKFGDNIGWTAEIAATKWFNPIVGARLQAVGGELKMSNEAYDKFGSYWIMPHIDGMINLSNWIGGYRDDRVYYAKAFAGMGVSIVDVNDGASAGFAFNAGMNHTFRLGSALDMNLEMKTVLCAGRDMPDDVSEVAGRFGQIYSVTIGLTYRFNKKNWSAAYSQIDVDAYLAAIAVLEAGLAESMNNEAVLIERLEQQQVAHDSMLRENQQLQTELVREEHIHTNHVISSSAIFFKINCANLSEQAKATLQLVVDMIKESPEGTNFTIVGHADAETGTPEYNQALSERRAETVYNYLVEQGVDKGCLTWKGVGATDSIFPVNNTNRVVIVE